MCTRFSPASAVIEQSFTGQCVADGRYRNRTANVIRQKQDDFLEQHGICKLALPSALFPLENVTNDDRRIDALQKSQRLILFHADVGNTGHAAKAHVGIKNLAQFVLRTILIDCFLLLAAKCALDRLNRKAVKINELRKGQRQHLDFHTSSG